MTFFHSHDLSFADFQQAKVGDKLVFNAVDVKGYMDHFHLVVKQIFPDQFLIRAEKNGEKLIFVEYLDPKGGGVDLLVSE